jgi:hypothetical protein
MGYKYKPRPISNYLKEHFFKIKKKKERKEKIVKKKVLDFALFQNYGIFFSQSAKDFLYTIELSCKNRDTIKFSHFYSLPKKVNYFYNRPYNLDYFYMHIGSYEVDGNISSLEETSFDKRYPYMNLENLYTSFYY